MTTAKSFAQRFGISRLMHKSGSSSPARKIVVGVVGSSVMAVGVAMIVLPGPAFIVIPLGLAVLATEFVWARRFLRRAKVRFERAKRRARKARHDSRLARQHNH